MTKSFHQIRSSHLPLILLIAVWLCVVIWRDSSMAQKVAVENFPEPPSVTTQVIMQASDVAFVYRFLLPWLQQFDVQSGQYVAYRNLDYTRLTGWLNSLQKMAPESQYPTLMATRIYTKVGDEQRIRQMLDFIYQQYQLNPEKKWRWLAEAAVIARHRLKDLPLALSYAQKLANEPSNVIPYWARDMQLTILEDMGEFEQVKLLVGGLLANKAITDDNEIRFLNLLLERLQKNNN